jgi:hypothetical protein
LIELTNRFLKQKIVPEDSKLQEFQLKHLETVEFRLKLREIAIRNDNDEFQIQIDDTLTIECV